jgi:hypothetical protein
MMSVTLPLMKKKNIKKENKGNRKELWKEQDS